VVHSELFQAENAYHPARGAFNAVATEAVTPAGDSVESGSVSPVDSAKQSAMNEDKPESVGTTINDSDRFKGWMKPGPTVPGDVAPEPDETLDAISGRYRIFQYRDGHRFSTDDVLVASFATTHSIRAERALDLGSGIGSVALICAWRLPGTRFTTVEAQSRSIRLARKSVAYNGLEDRFTLREGDFRDPSVFPTGETFDLITGSPPYFPIGDGVLSEHPQKVECRFETRGDVGDYCAAAAPRLAPGGFLFLVFPRNQEERVIAGARAAGLAILRSREVHLREGEAPLLAVYQLGRAGDFPEGFPERLGPAGWREPPLTIRTADGRVHPEYSALKLSIGFPP
jgi:tRNA1(Val) A37 N6-methylase TrmN6